MDELLNALTQAIGSSLAVSFEARFFTDDDGKTWLLTSMQNKYETRNGCILYEADKPIKYYVNFLAPK